MDPADIELPDGLQHARTTPTFDQDTVPDGLLGSHRTGAGVWGRLVVASGSVRFTFEEEHEGPDEQRSGDPASARRLVAGEHQVIPPDRPHRVILDGPVSFAVEFHRPPATA